MAAKSKTLMSEKMLEALEYSQTKQKKASDGKAKIKADTGAHYRYSWRGLTLDPFRIALIYGIQHPAQFTVLKKILCTGKRGKKSLLEDINDCICSLERWKQMLDEEECDGKTND